MNDVWLKELAEEQTKRLLEYYIKLRKQHKLSQSELERITGVSRISINRYENGKIMPSVQAVNQLLVTMGYRFVIANMKRWRKCRMRRKLIYSLIGLVGCTWLAGCQEKPEGAQTIIIELADPTDMQENNTAVEGEIEAEESASEADAETMTDAQEMLTVAVPEIIGFSDGVELSYTQISSSDPIISLLLANVLPDVKVQDFDITNAQAYQNGEEIVPAGEITFTMTVEPETNVTLYRLNEDGELVSETLEVTDGTVSYQSTGCGRWLILDTLLEQGTEVMSESETEVN